MKDHRDLVETTDFNIYKNMLSSDLSIQSISIVYQKLENQYDVDKI